MTRSPAFNNVDFLQQPIESRILLQNIIDISLVLTVAIQGHADVAQRTRRETRREVQVFNFPQRFLHRTQHRVAKNAMVRYTGNNQRLVVGNIQKRTAIKSLYYSGIRVLANRAPQKLNCRGRLATQNCGVAASLHNFDVFTDDALHPVDEGVGLIVVTHPKIVNYQVAEGRAVGGIALDDFLENAQPLARAPQGVVSERRPVGCIAHRRIQVDGLLERLYCFLGPASGIHQQSLDRVCFGQRVIERQRLVNEAYRDG